MSGCNCMGPCQECGVCRCRCKCQKETYKDTPPGEAEGYTIVVDIEPHADGGWVGTSPAYPDVAAYCDTKEQAVCEVADAVIALTFFDKTNGEA